MPLKTGKGCLVALDLLASLMAPLFCSAFELLNHNLQASMCHLAAMEMLTAPPCMCNRPAPLQAELGYERVKIGPTTNFVGNHMTQGAIDLVQAQLEGPAEATPPPLLLGAAAAATAAAAGPCLLRAGPAAALAAPVPPRPVQQYSWADAGGTVHVDVPVAQLWLGLRGNTKAEVCCEITSDRMDLLIQDAPPLPVAQPAADAEEFSFSPGGGSAGGKGASGSGAAPSGPLHQLHLHPLSAPVVPTLCRCFVRGPPALLPCSSSGSLGGGGEEAQPEGQDKPAQEAAQLLSIRFCLPPGAEALVVELAKADPTQQWEALQAAPALPLARATSSPEHPPDLTRLRWMLRPHGCQSLGWSPGRAWSCAHPTFSDRCASCTRCIVRCSILVPWNALHA